jgi:membrane-bound metal-dependent hydrolase YbcI (DUF457 family)
VSIRPVHIVAAYPFRTKLDLWGFALVNIIIDLEVILKVMADQIPGLDGQLYLGDRLHGEFHTLAGATMVGLITALFRMRLWGALLGAWSHVLIDMFCHSDVWPLDPWIEGNPVQGYLIGMPAMDILLIAPVVL